MADMLVKLYNIPHSHDIEENLFKSGIVTVQPCDWQKREIEKVFSSDYPHGNT